MPAFRKRRYPFKRRRRFVKRRRTGKRSFRRGSRSKRYCYHCKNKTTHRVPLTPLRRPSRRFPLIPLPKPNVSKPEIENPPQKDYWWNREATGVADPVRNYADAFNITPENMSDLFFGSLGTIAATLPMTAPLFDIPGLIGDAYELSKPKPNWFSALEDLPDWDYHPINPQELTGKYALSDYAFAGNKQPLGNGGWTRESVYPFPSRPKTRINPGINLTKGVWENPLRPHNTSLSTKYVPPPPAAVPFKKPFTPGNPLFRSPAGKLPKTIRPTLPFASRAPMGKGILSYPKQIVPPSVYTTAPPTFKPSIPFSTTSSYR